MGWITAKPESDERMPGMSGSEFLAVVHQKYPTVISIILTGQASLEAAIRAINEGEIYRFLTKPCKGAELIVTLRHALQMKQLKEESQRLLAISRKQKSLLISLEQEHPGITKVNRTIDGRIIIDDNDLDISDLTTQIQHEVEEFEANE